MLGSRSEGKKKLKLERHLGKETRSKLCRVGLSDKTHIRAITGNMLQSFPKKYPVIKKVDFKMKFYVLL